MNKLVEEFRKASKSAKDVYQAGVNYAALLKNLGARTYYVSNGGRSSEDIDRTKREESYIFGEIAKADKKLGFLERIVFRRTIQEELQRQPIELKRYTPKYDAILPHLTKAG